jgi:hypothetical protein
MSNPGSVPISVSGVAGCKRESKRCSENGNRNAVNPGTNISCTFVLAFLFVFDYFYITI